MSVPSRDAVVYDGEGDDSVAQDAFDGCVACVCAARGASKVGNLKTPLNAYFYGRVLL